MRTYPLLLGAGMFEKNPPADNIHNTSRNMSDTPSDIKDEAKNPMNQIIISGDRDDMFVQSIS
jgi:hypothetical protein